MEALILISLGSNLILLALLAYERNQRVRERDRFAKYLKDIDTE